MVSGASARQRLARLEADELACQVQLDRIRASIVALRTGIRGEDVVADILTRLPPGWRVLNDRRKSADSLASIDHIVIGPSGVHVIDAKSWTRRLWVGDRVPMGSRTPPVDETATAIQLRDVIALDLAAAGIDVPVFGVVSFATEGAVQRIAAHDAVAVVPPSQLLIGLTSSPAVVSVEQASRIWKVLDDLHPPRAGIAESLPREPRPATRLEPSPRAAAPEATRGPNPRRRAVQLLRVVGPILVLLVACGLAKTVLHATSHTTRPTRNASQPR